jgi:hypothetical protein
MEITARDALQMKLRRWQKMIDGTMNAHNPVVQQARDETLQMVINEIESILRTHKK